MRKLWWIGFENEVILKFLLKEVTEEKSMKRIR